MSHNKFGLIISIGSAATYLRSGGQHYISFVANFVLFLAVKNFEYRLNFDQVTAKPRTFFGMQCIYNCYMYLHDEHSFVITVIVLVGRCLLNSCSNFEYKVYWSVNTCCI